MRSPPVWMLWLAQLGGGWCTSLSPRGAPCTSPSLSRSAPTPRGPSVAKGPACDWDKEPCDGHWLRLAFSHDDDDETWKKMEWYGEPCPTAEDEGKEWIGPYCGDQEHQPGRVTWLALQYPIDPTQLKDRTVDTVPDLSALPFTLSAAIGKLDQLKTFALTDLALFSGTLPAELGNLARLEEFYLYNNPKLSGTIPWALGHVSSMTTLSLYANPQLSGTLPMWGNLTDNTNRMPNLASLYLTDYPLISGTIPELLGHLGHAGSKGAKPKLKELYLNDNPRLTGTIPGSVGNLTALEILCLQRNKGITGSIPLTITNLTNVQQLFLSEIAFTGTIPPEIGNMTALSSLYLDGNPNISGTLPATLARLKNLHRFDCFDNVGLTGSMPGLKDCSSLSQLDMQNCSFRQLPASLPDSLTHAYLNNNPINNSTFELSNLLRSLPNKSLRVLDVGLVNSQVQLVGKGPGQNTGYGTRVLNPSPCVVGKPCAFVLHIYDQFDRPLKVGGMISILTIGLDGTHSRSQMLDNRDGTFTAAIPEQWVTTPGSHLFRFYHGSTEFKPMMNGPHSLAVDFDCYNVPKGQDGYPEGRYGGNCTGLRTVQFLPNCDGEHTKWNPENSSCHCEDGYEPSNNTAGNHPLRCHIRCKAAESVSDDGDKCVCADGHYDADVYGVLVCNKGGWDADLNRRAVQGAQQTRQKGKCATVCDNACTICENGVPRIRKNWRLNFTDTATQTAAKTFTDLLAHANAKTGLQVQVVFSCPSGADCPELPLKETASVTCPNNHAARLCAACKPDFSLTYQKTGGSDSKFSKNLCLECKETAVYIEDTFGIAVGWFVVISLVVVALGCALMYHTKQHVRRLKVNFRIILGAIQVWSLLPAVLQLAFPGSSGLILHYFALFVFDLRDVVRLECWGWDWKSRWWASVLLLPLVASVPITAFWLWQQKKIRKLERASMKRAYKRARDQVIGAFLFLAMLLYPQLSSAILSALRCRKLGPELSVLEADYSQDCIIDTVNGTSVFAYGLLFLVPLGLPAFLFALLRTQRKDSARKWDFGVASGRMPPDMIAIVQADGSQRDFQHKKAEDFFGFCVEDYRKDCYWYEPVDMLRKLALSGLLQFVHRGTAAQCFCGCGIAFTSFGLQQWLQPYREWESNVLKACVDTQLFLTFLISFILRVLPQMEMDTAEPLQEADYGWLLVGSLVLLLIAFVGLTISEARRTKIWVASTVTFLSKKFERIISDRIQHVDTSDGPLEPLDRDGSSFVSDQATASTDAAAADKFAQDATVALLDVNRSRASSLDEADETFDLEPEPEPEGVQLGFLSGAE